MSNVAKLILCYAYLIAKDIDDNQNYALVHCRNSRFRFPSVIAAFFIIFRNISKERCLQWLKEAFPDQRPDRANVSSCFPNFDKFEQVLRLLVDSRENPSKKLESYAFCLDGKLMQLNIPSLCEKAAH